MKSSAVVCMAAAMLMVAVGAARAAETKVDYAKELDTLLPDMSSDDLGKRQAAQGKFGEMSLAAGQPGAEAERLALCQAILPKLGPETAEEGRVWLIRQLQLIGRAECVSALVGLLGDKTPNVAESARRALQVNSSDQAGEALRTALGKAATPEVRVAMINAVAQRRDAKAVPALAKLLADKDEPTALAAAAGLGKIGGPAAVKALAAAKAGENVRKVILDSYLLCGDQYVTAGKNADAAAIYKEMYAKENPTVVRAAGLRGLVVALGEKAVPTLAEVFADKDEPLRRVAIAFIKEIPGPGATKALADLLPRLDPEMQAALLRELGDRGDVAAKPAVLAAAKSDQEPVRVAALGALAGVGEAADALVLAQTAAATEGRIRDTARASLDRMVAKGADEAMQTAMAGGEIKVRLELIRALGARHAPAALPAIMKAAEDADAGVRVEAMRALEAMADEKSVDLLVRLITSPKQDNEREPAERALAAACARAADKDALAATLVKALGGASGPAKAALLRPLTRLGGEKAFAPVRAALGDADAGVKDTAIRVVAEWPDDAALEDMIALAKSDPKESNQVLALRGYLRLARERERKEEDRLKMAQVALPLAKRPDEQKQVLGVLRDLRSVEALRLAAPLMSEEKVKGEAIDATVRIARQIGGKLPDEVKGAMEQAIKLTTDERIRREAGEVLKKIEDQQKK